MTSKNMFRLIGTLIILWVMQTSVCLSITIDELVDKCQLAESAIQDVSLEYEYYVIPPSTLEEAQKEIGAELVGVYKDGIVRHKLSSARFFETNDVNSFHSPYRWRILSERSGTIIAEKGASWDDLTKESYDGQIYKKSTVGGWHTSEKSGLISERHWEDSRGNVLLSPIGFSILRFEVERERVLLSTLLRQKAIKNQVRIGNSAEKIGDFNTICVEVLLQLESRQVPVRRVYFSIQHNYTPVKYEYLNPTKEGFKLSHTVEVQSVQSVGDGLWFPSSGIIQDGESPKAYGFRATSKIVVNKGLKKEDFNIEFQPGTKVSDQIAGREYTVKEETTE
ncbi:MAG: hypothetical protein IMZ61_12555 [Planctomycetes bacterium]|nr:hypothetical protein [Planctomycetota bacterium]